ncbi:hypothetical protein QCA50_014874 [Cerrena zonata]|uniref:Vomeronasal type-1 receptor n=1 Tax=Cerrena zonata TaxID=2478898 RepID=A0AAW0FX63_9APHY
MPCNSWLFFIRIRGLYTHHSTVVGVFAALWTLTLTSIALPFSYTVSISHQPNGSCSAVSRTHPYLGVVPFIVLVIFDTAVIIGISYGMSSVIPTRSIRSKLRSLLVTNNMGQLSRAFLRTGQVYYLTTVGIHLSVVIISLTRTSTMSVLNISEIALLSSVVQNIMTCRVHRLLKFAQVNDDSSSVTPVVFITGSVSESQPSVYTTSSSSYPGDLSSEGRSAH